MMCHLTIYWRSCLGGTYGTSFSLLTFLELLIFLPCVDAAALISAIASDSLRAAMSKVGVLQLLLFLFSRGIAMGVWTSEVILLRLGHSLAASHRSSLRALWSS